MKQLLLTLTLFLCLGALPQVAKADCPRWNHTADGFYCNEGDNGVCNAATICFDPDGNQDYNGDPWDEAGFLFWDLFGYPPDADTLKQFIYYVLV